MRIEEIGIFIGGARKAKGISQKTLCRGICSANVLSDYETGKSVPELMLAEALFQRLGMSIEKFEIIITDSIYSEVELRDNIEENIRFGNTAQAEIKLKEYYDKYVKNGSLEEVYYIHCLGIIEHMKGEYEKAEKLYYRAMNATVKGIEPKYYYKELFSALEIENIILYAKVNMDMGKYSKAKDILLNMNRYLNHHMHDAEEMINLKSKLAALLGQIYNREQKYNECVKLCETAIELEREHMVMICFPMLADNLIYAYDRLKRKEEKQFLEKHKENIRQIFEDYGLDAEILNNLYFSVRTRQYHIIGEIVAGELRRFGITQTDLCKDIYEDSGAISRIVAGKKNPSRSKLNAIMDMLKIEKTKYNGNIITDNFELIELEMEFERLAYKGQYDEVWKILYILEKQLDMTERTNIQLIESYKTLQLLRRKEITKEQAKEKNRELIRMTYTDKPEKYYRLPFHNEMYIYNQLCLLTYRTGEQDKAIRMYKGLIEMYKKSKVNLRYHFRDIGLVLINVTRYMEMKNILDESEKYAKKGIRLCLLSGKATGLSEYISNIACVEEKRGTDKRTCEGLLHQALNVAELFKLEKDRTDIYNYIKAHYNIN